MVMFLVSNVVCRMMVVCSVGWGMCCWNVIFGELVVMCFDILMCRLLFVMLSLIVMWVLLLFLVMVWLMMVNLECVCFCLGGVGG